MSKEETNPKPDDLQISTYMHCRNCMSGKLAVGFTKLGLQVWCENCNLNVLHLNFLGQKVARIA